MTDHSLSITIEYDPSVARRTMVPDYQTTNTKSQETAAELYSAEINLGDDSKGDQVATGTVVDESPNVDEQDIDPHHPLSAKDKIKLRMRYLKQKINQARQLNKQAVKEEGERLSETDRDRKRQETRKNNTEKETAWNQAHQKTLELASKTGVDAKNLAQTAAESLNVAEKQAAKSRLNAYHVNDYHNPEGQYRNYERSIRSVRRNVENADESTYDPLDAVLTTSGDREGAHLVATELQRRYEKSRKRDLKRKDKQDVEGSYINKRNKHFNKKISRTYDAATAEIKQNLERGTAL